MGGAGGGDVKEAICQIIKVTCILVRHAVEEELVVLAPADGEVLVVVADGVKEGLFVAVTVVGEGLVVVAAGVGEDLANVLPVVFRVGVELSAGIVRGVVNGRGSSSALLSLFGVQREPVNYWIVSGFYRISAREAGF